MKGFTLIEILISLTIIGLLFGFGFANFRDYSQRQQLLSVARNIQGELRLIQGKASAGEKPIGCDTLSSYSFLINAASYQIAAVCGSGNMIIKTEDLPSGITLTATGDNPVLFKILGQGIAGEGVVISLTQTGTSNVTAVTVTKGGEIK